MQTAAPEAVNIKITSVDTTAGKDGDQVAARAIVLSVTRSATGLARLQKLSIAYAHTPLAAGMAGPGPVPVLENGATYTAYLTGGPDPTPYAPAAGAQSFVYNVNWATPANPTPNGWMDIDLQKHPDMASFNLQPTGNYYTVTYSSRQGPPGTWPLLATGNPPALLHLYYNSVVGAPVQILVYVGGTMPAGDPAGTILTVERAVIISLPSEKPLGDALWAVRAPTGSPALAQPTWTWSRDSLTVTNPFEKTIQTISLTPKAGK
jgi:hypothetical protein